MSQKSHRTIEDLFARFLGDPSSCRELHGPVTLSLQRGKSYVFLPTSPRQVLQTEQAEGSVFEIDDDELEMLLTGKRTPQELFQQKCLTLRGNPRDLQIFSELFE